MEKHEYQAPGPNDLRSPCPALNTLANHGYLPRDGKDITPAQIADAIYEAYNISKVAGYAIAQAGFLVLGKTFEGKISLDDLFGERIEHPMSLTRPDIGLSEDYKKVSPKLIDSLFSEKNENNKLTKESFARQFIKRRDQSLKDNPKFTGLTYGKRIQIFGEYAMSLICFPENENGRGEEVDVNTLEGFYKYERIPENWKKPEQIVGVYNIISTINEMRKVEERVENEQEEDKKKE